MPSQLMVADQIDDPGRSADLPQSVNIKVEIVAPLESLSLSLALASTERL